MIVWYTLHWRAPNVARWSKTIFSVKAERDKAASAMRTDGYDVRPEEPLVTTDQGAANVLSCN